MANSKSNIYPIQLQEAELNLNKYDAEIKQYSGFNKNNSPFVGGCLSNLFRKDETITGSDGRNVYIDDNGNVYRVTEDGLFKNDEKIINVQNKLFWNKERVETDDNTVRVFNEKISVLKTHDSNNIVFKLKINDTLYNFLSYSLELYSLESIEKRIWEQMTCIYLTFVDKVFAVISGGDRSKIITYVVDLDTYEIVSTDSRTFIVGDAGYRSAILFDETSSQLVCFNTDTLFFYSFNTSTGSITYLGKGTTIPSSVETSTKKLYQTSLSSQASLSRYTFCSYPYNCCCINQQWFEDITFPDKVNVIAALGNPYWDNGIKFRNVYTFDGSKVSFIPGYSEFSSMPINFDNLTASNGKSESNLLSVFDVQLPALINSDGTVNDLISIIGHFTPTDKISSIGFSFSDKTSQGVELSSGRYVFGDKIKLGESFYLLFNNNQFSAISGDSVLLTEWNSIDLQSLTFFSDKRSASQLYGVTDERIYYKQNNKWYVIKHGTPFLRLFENQIVINAEQIQNSYQFKENKILQFASNLNCIKLNVSLIGDYGCLAGSNVDNVYVGFAKNEYNQKDNSSIILNPLSVCIKVTNNKLPGGRLFSSPVEGYVNFYGNFDIMGNIYANETSFPYVFTQYIWNDHGLFVYYKNLNEDLLGLSFPVDSNGNVEYNVNLFSEIKSIYGNSVFITSGSYSYPLIVGNNNEVIMSFYLASGIENLSEMFIIQGQFYGIINDNLFSLNYQNGVLSGVQFIVSVEGLQYCGNTPYEALFYSATNKCLYSFTGANILQSKQFVDKINVVKSYKYNPATQSIFLLTDIGVLVYSLFGIYCIDMPEAENMFLLNNGVVLCDNEGHYRYIRYYKEDVDTDYIKENIKLETCFYGMNNQTVTINDCLYLRLFSEEHEEGEVRISSSVISLEGRVTEETVYHFTANDWDKMTHSIYMRYQPKNQRGLGISFSVDSPFKIASMSVGSQPDAILIDKVSKGAINVPSVTTNNNEW